MAPVEIDIEIITCKTPMGNEYAVYLPYLPWSESKELLWERIDRMFASFGPIYKTMIFPSKLPMKSNQGPVYYSIVTYYSSKTVKRVLLLNRKLEFEGHKLNIQRTKFPKSNAIKLRLHESQDLISHYFGFNSWSSHLIYIEQEKVVESPDLVRFICLVKVIMITEGVNSEGVGIGEQLMNCDAPHNRGTVFKIARRFAYQDAMMNAFSKFVIIILGNGKKTIDVDTTEDDLLYDPAWDNPVVKVKDLNVDPDEESDSEDFGFQEMSETQLDAALNVTT